MEELKVTDAAAVPGSAAMLVQHGDKAFMYDMGFGFCADEMADMVENELYGKKPDCIILTHSHYDHVMGAAALAERWKGIPVIGGEYTSYVFSRDSAKDLMFEMDVNAAREMGKECFEANCTDGLRVDITVKDGEIIDVCGLKLQALAFPGHTKCSMGFYCPENKTLLSSETLGVYGENGAMPILLTSYVQGMQSLEKARALDAENIVLPHYGMISGKENCRKYFESAEREFSWVRDNVLYWHGKGLSNSDIIEKIKEKYYTGHIEDVYPLKAFYLNTGYMVPAIIREYSEYHKSAS